MNGAGPTSDAPAQRDADPAGPGVYRPFGNTMILRAHHLVVRDDAQSAVARGVDELVARGFVAAAPALEEALGAAAPGWTLRVVTIGDNAATWRRGALASALSLATLGFGALLIRRRVEKTWVVVAAHPRGDGGTDLHVAPFASRWGEGGEGTASAGPWVAEAGEALAQRYGAGGALLAAPERRPFVVDPQSPAYPKTFRSALKRAGER